MTEATVTFPKEEYDRLRKDQLFLEALERLGVDNWDWYSDAYRDYLQEARELGFEPKED